MTQPEGGREMMAGRWRDLLGRVDNGIDPGRDYRNILNCYFNLVRKFPLTHCDELIGEVSVWVGKGEEIHSLLQFIWQPSTRYMRAVGGLTLHAHLVPSPGLGACPGLVTFMPVTHRFPSSFKAFVLQNQREQHNESLHNHVRIVERPIPALKYS